MDRIDDYLRTLRIFLPKEQRDDIIRELGEEMRAQAAEKEAVLGRPLRADEQSAIVAQYGHPLITAARYRPQRSLIGPLVFPYYWLLLKVLIALVMAGHMIGAAMRLANGASFAQMGDVVKESAPAPLGADAAGRTRQIVDAVNQFLSFLLILIAAAGVVRSAGALLHYISGPGHRATPA